MSYIVKATPRTSEQLNALQTFMKESNIPHNLIPAIPSIIPSTTTNPIYHVERPNTCFKVNSEIKLFLGNEFINAKGEVTFEDILQRIFIYTRSNKLLSHDSYGFYLDDTLQGILKTFSKKINWEDLYQHILLLLVKIN